MNDFDDRLSKALRDDHVDSSRHPNLDDASRGWRRRRQGRVAGVAGVLSVLAVGAGFGIATLAQNDPTERLVTDTVSTVVPVPTTADLTPPTTLDAVPTTAGSVPATTETPATEPPSTESSVTTSSTPATETSGLDVATGFVARTTVFDIDNRLEIRSTTNEVLWSYQYCEVGQSCNASVETVLADGFWVLVGESPDERGYPMSSTLRRVGIDGSTAEMRAESPTGTYFAAAQPTVLGDLVAVAVPDQIAGRLIDISITDSSGATTELVTGVSDVEVSADGRYVATTSARPSEDYGRVYFSVFDLQTGETNEITLEGVVSAAPLEFSADGSRLVIRDTWEDQRDFVIDPWMDSPTFVAPDATVSGSEICLVDDSTAAVADWNRGYGESGVTTGPVRKVDLDSGDETGGFDVDTFGRQLVCGPDGAVTFVRVPLVEKNLGTEDNPFFLVEQDFGAPVDVVRIDSDGGQQVLASGTVGVSTIR